jgi:hypothetical protein
MFSSHEWIHFSLCYFIGSIAIISDLNWVYFFNQSPKFFFFSSSFLKWILSSRIMIGMMALSMNVCVIFRCDSVGAWCRYIKALICRQSSRKIIWKVCLSPPFILICNLILYYTKISTKYLFMLGVWQRKCTVFSWFWNSCCSPYWHATAYGLYLIESGHAYKNKEFLCSYVQSTE